MALELSPEVQHLTPIELEELYSRYMAGEKNQDLMNEYGIDASPNKLYSLFPPVMHDSLVCEYCSLPLYCKPRSKTGYAYTMEYFCLECSHKEGYHYSQPLVCNCSPCRHRRAEQAKAKLKSDLKKVSQEYDLDKVALFDYSTLSLRHKCYLLSLFLMQSDIELNHIKSLNNSGSALSLSPTFDFDNEIILKLYKDSVIAVDPTSPISAFDESKNFKSFNYREVLWVVNVSKNGTDRLDLEGLFKLIYLEFCEGIGIQAEWVDDLKELVFRLAEEEAKSYLDYCLDQLQLPEAPMKTNEVIKEVLNRYSVSESYYFIKKSVENAHLFYARGKASSKKHAANTIPSKLLELATRANNEQWDLYKYNRNYHIERSQLSIVLFDLLIGGGDDIAFYKSPKCVWDNELSKILEFSEEKVESKSSTHCVSCGSQDVTIKADENSLTLFCSCCGDKKQFVASN